MKIPKSLVFGLLMITFGIYAFISDLFTSVQTNVRSFVNSKINFQSKSWMNWTFQDEFIVNNFGFNHNLTLRKDRQREYPFDQLKIILMWNEAYGSKKYNLGFGREPFYEVNVLRIMIV